MWSALVLAVAVASPFLAGMVAWALWLRKRALAPRWLCVTPIVLVVVAPPVTGLVSRTYWASRLGNEDPMFISRKAWLLGHAISEAMNCGALMFGIAVLWLLAVTWRYRWRPGR